MASKWRHQEWVSDLHWARGANRLADGGTRRGESAGRARARAVDQAQAERGRERAGGARATAKSRATRRASARSKKRAGSAPSSSSRPSPTPKGARSDAALYWKAYALDKLGQKAEALAAAAELIKDYPDAASG